jgi:hypothetical protein
MDIKLLDGDAVFINGPLTIAGVTHFAQDVVAQRLTIRLRTFYSEYFINTTYGVPFFERILTKNVSKTTVDNIFREQILGESGVLEIQEFNSTFDAGSRMYSCSFTVMTREGSASVTITV